MAIDEKKLIDESTWHPSTLEFETDAENYNKGWNDCNRDWIKRIEKLSLENKTSDKWIPCGERLPELYKSVLVTVKTQGGNACYVSERFVINGEELWSALCGRKPIAWMYLPEPYKGE